MGNIRLGPSRQSLAGPGCRAKYTRFDHLYLSLPTVSGEALAVEHALAQSEGKQCPYMPSSTATFRQIGLVTIVDLSGLLMLGESSAVLRSAISELMDKRRSKIVLNFRDVTQIDSAGIGELVAAYATVKNKEGRLKLLSPPKKVCEVLKLTQLQKVLEVYADEESAVRSFS
jgi:anti-sigma B factor antagonist